MEIEFLKKFNFALGLEFNVLNKSSSREIITYVYNLLKLNNNNNIYSVVNNKELINNIDLLFSKIQNGALNLYFLSNNNIIYTYIIVSKIEDNINIIEISSNRNKIMKNSTYLLLDFLIYSNLNCRVLRIYNYHSDLLNYFSGWLKPDKITADVMIYLNLNIRIDRCKSMWENIFNKESNKESNKNRITKNIDFVLSNHNNISFHSTNGEFLVCKKAGEKNFSNLKEIIFYTNLNHPNIVKICKVENADFYMKYYNNIIPNEVNIKKLLYQILLALDYIHSKGILHSDIKPGNILTDEYDNYYLIDFGISDFYSFAPRMRKYICTIGYAVENLPINNNLNVDIFSLGITVIKLITGHPTYKDSEDYETSLNVINLIDKLKEKIVSRIGENGFDLIHSMLGLKGNYISSDEALNHKFFGHTYIKIMPTFDKSIIIHIDWNNNILPYKKYIEVVKWILNLSDSKNCYSLTYLLIIQLLRRIISKNKIDTNNIFLYAAACFILGYCANEDYFMAYYTMNNHLDNKYTGKEISDTCEKILALVEYKFKLIPYNYFYQNDRMNKINFAYTFTFYEGEQDYSLLDFHELFDNEKWFFNIEISLFQNIIQRLKN